MSHTPKTVFVGYPAALASLEHPIHRVLDLAQTLAMLTDHAFHDQEEQAVTELQVKSFGFIADEILEAARKLDALWLEHYNSSPDDPATAAMVPVVGEAR